MKKVKCKKCGKIVSYTKLGEFSLSEAIEITEGNSGFYLCRACYAEWKLLQQRFLSSILKDGDSANFIMDADYNDYDSKMFEG